MTIKFSFLNNITHTQTHTHTHIHTHIYIYIYIYIYNEIFKEFLNIWLSANVLVYFIKPSSGRFVDVKMLQLKNSFKWKKYS